MAKKKAKKKSAKSKTAAAKKSTPAKKTLKKQPKKAAPKKKVAAKKKPAPKKKALAKTKSPIAKKAARKTAPKQKRVRVEAQILESSSFARPRPAALSGDLQGLSNIEGADSESVDELLDEGNAFEAGVVAGVERARNNEGKEVRTHEVPEDDVPEEYLDKD